MLRTVERQHRGLVVHDSLDVDRPAPDELDVGQHIGGPVLLQVYAIMLMAEQQFTPVPVVAVHHVYPRFPEVRQAEQQP